MRLAVTGSGGMIGSALVEALRASGHTVTRVVRSPRPATNAERLIVWNPARGSLDANALEGHDAVVHLAGEPLIGIWTSAKKARIRDSRVRGTALLARGIAALQRPPRLLISASAIGYYGDRPPYQEVTEQTGVGSGFLASVAAEWEDAAQPARAAGVRVVNSRFGLVLSSRGGALAVMLPLFRAGLGGTIAGGAPVWSWISLSDVVGGLLFLLTHDTIAGPVNFTAPTPVTNAEFTRTLGRVLNRPALLTAPRWMMKLALGDLANDLLLSSARVVPRRLLDEGYAFKHPELEGALRALLPR